MAYPPEIETFTLTFGAAGVLGIAQDLAMEVDFYAATNALWAATGQPFLQWKQTARAEPGQDGEAVLISPDQDGFVNGAGQAVRNWTYLAKIRYLTATGDLVGSADKNFAYLASMGPVVDLDTTVPVTTSAGVVVDVPPAGGSSYSDEQARDAVAAALRGINGITITVNDAANTITIVGSGGTGTGGGYDGGTDTGTTSPTYLVTNAGDQLVTDTGDLFVTA